jgi:inhibitor of cysteine peptidase
MDRKVIVSATRGIALLFALLLVAGCQPGEPVETPEPVEGTVIDESHNGGQVELPQGETLVVRLESNPSTGYLWEIDELDEGIVQQVGDTVFESSVQDDPPPGTGGWTIFQFRGVGNGESELRLIYHQPWTEEEPLSTFSVRIVVR